jgi:hypothetical protein
MTAHPVQLHVLRAERIPRIQVAVRIVLVVALAIISWPAIYWLLYLTLPAIVALILLQKGLDTFRDRDAPRLVLALRWLAAAEAYLCFLTNEIPTSARGAVDLQVNLTGAPTAGSALVRLLFSLPALLLVALLSAASSLVWVVAALFALAMERIPRVLGDLLLFVLRLKYRLAAYHLSLVDRYPSLAEHAQGASLDHALST